MYRCFASLLALVVLAGLCGCEDECFDYYPHHEVPTSQPDMVKSGTDYYGGFDNNYRVILPTSDTSTTTPATGAITTKAPDSGGAATK
jgi:hypothetical protein